MVLTAFGVTINDSITAVTPEEFTLIAGLLALNGATAGAGLTFSGHQYALLVDDYLGNVLYVDGDSLKVRVNAPIYFRNGIPGGDAIGLLRSQNSGLYGTDSLKILPQVGGFLYTLSDTLKERLSFYFYNNDSLAIDWNTNHFNLTYGVSPSVNVKLDSGLTSSSSGLRAWLDNARVKYTSLGKITVAETVAGDGLIWSSDAMKILFKTPFRVTNDTFMLGYNDEQFSISSPAGIDQLDLVLDSGLTSGADGVRSYLDNLRLKFTSSSKITIADEVAGTGLFWQADSLGINMIAPLTTTASNELKLHY